MNETLWVCFAVAPLVLVGMVSGCLARPDWVRGLRSYVARVQWEQCQASMKQSRGQPLRNEEFSSIMHEYYLYKGGAGRGDRLTAFREMSALDGTLRHAALCELSETIAEQVKMLAAEKGKSPSHRQAPLLSGVLRVILGSPISQMDELSEELLRASFSQADLLELLIAVQLCVRSLQKPSV